MKKLEITRLFFLFSFLWSCTASLSAHDDDPFLGIASIHAEVPEGVEGVPVKPLMNSTAWAMGLEKGDVLIRIDDYPIADWHDLEEAINARQVGDDITVYFLRDGIFDFRTRPIKSWSATHNNSSRHNGVAVEQNPDPAARPAQALIEPASAPEIEALEDSADMDMPAISGLEIRQLKLFPNPNNGIFDIRFEIASRGRTLIRVFSLDGRQVYANDLGQFSGTFSDRIDISNNVRGAYFLEIRQGEQAEVKKLIFQ